MVTNFGMGSYVSGQLVEVVLTVNYASNAIHIHYEHIIVKPDMGENGHICLKVS